MLPELSLEIVVFQLQLYQYQLHHVGYYHLRPEDSDTYQPPMFQAQAQKLPEARYSAKELTSVYA